MCILGVTNARVRLNVLLRDLIKKTEERYMFNTFFHFSFHEGLESFLYQAKVLKMANVVFCYFSNEGEASSPAGR